MTDTARSIEIPTDPYGRISGKTLASLFSRHANLMSGDDSALEFAEEITRDHRTLQQSMTGTLLTAIVAMAQAADSGWVDGRNQASAGVCQKIRDLLVDENVYISSEGVVRFAVI